MLEVGNGGMTGDEYRTHMSFWCILAAPLIAGHNLTAIDAETRDILTNPELIAVDQDRLGYSGSPRQEGPIEVWMKPLQDGSTEARLFCRGWGAMHVIVEFRDVGLGNSAVVRNLWARKKFGPFQDKYTATVFQHGVVMLQLKRGT
jgi:alpha-galactosidase